MTKVCAPDRLTAPVRHGVPDLRTAGDGRSKVPWVKKYNSPGRPRKTGAGLLDMMRELNRATGMTFLFSTHDQMIMERATRLVTLKDGRIEKDETKR